MGNQSLITCSLPRKSRFPFQVSKVCFCRDVSLPVNIPVFIEDGQLEHSPLVIPKIADEIVLGGVEMFYRKQKNLQNSQSEPVK